ncbi:IS200/IS605 family accessory protein TnpB-related protein [Streptomyces sp. NPDC057271]|uniref:IS200/IS605 family accessory protein TnpB-related protein n=1 Tax=Streptomyces sp. NPDC057271 TaxID=3346078 RepID=UPI003625680C
MANLRENHLHQATARIPAEYGTVVVEDLNVKGMVRNRRLSRRISDAAFGELRRQLTYKTQRHGGRLIVADELGLLEDLLPLRCGESQAAPRRACLRVRRLRTRPGPGRERRPQPDRPRGGQP